MDNEEEVYEAFDHANKFKLGVIAGVKIISDVKANNIEEVKRLIPSSLWAMLTLRLNGIANSNISKVIQSNFVN